MEITRLLVVALGVVIVDSAIELAFVSSMVAWLHRTASGTFTVDFNGSTFKLLGEPRHLLVDQGHSSNGSAGTGLIIVGLGGLLALWLRGKSTSQNTKSGIAFYYTWLVFTILALVFTLATLAYVFAVTNAHRGQTIDVAFAATLVDTRYTLEKWTPQNWFSAFLRLNLSDDAVRRDIATHLRVMRGWQYNLIPMFLIQLVTTILAVLDALKWRNEKRAASNDNQEKQSL